MTVPDDAAPREPDALRDAVGPDRRAFVKGLVVGSVFAAPVVSSFTMSGIEAVFGSKAGATVLMSNSNTAGPSYPTLVTSGLVTLTGLALTAGGPHNTQVTLGVPAGALPVTTRVSVYTGNPASFASRFPAGNTPESAFAVAWLGPSATSPIMLTVRDPAVAAGDQIFLVTDSSLTAQSYPGAVDTSLWAVLVTKDPNFVVARPPVTPANAPSTGSSGAAAAVPAQPTFTG